MGVTMGLPLFRPRTVSSEKLHTLMPRRNNDEIMVLLMRAKVLTRYDFAMRYFLLRLSSRCLERRHALSSAKLCLSTACPLREIDNIVQMGVDAPGERATGLHLLVVLLHKAFKVLFRSPLSIVDDAGPICASMQRRPN